MSALRDELLQVAAVACAIIEDLTFGQANSQDRAGLRSGWDSQAELVLADIEAERICQDDKWGPQHHTPIEWLMILLKEVGKVADVLQVPDVLGLEGKDLLHMRAALDVIRQIREEGRFAGAWCRHYDWPDPKHRALHRGEEQP